MDSLLMPLASTLNLPLDRFVLAPGNHDLDRGYIDEFLEPGLKSMGDTDSVDRLIGMPHFGQAIARLDAWHKFRTQFYEKGDPGSRPTEHTPLANVHRFDMGGTTIGIAALDSAWRATGAPDDRDRGFLLLGETQTRNALDAIDDCTLRMVAFHHPLEWLAPWNHQVVRELFEHRGIIVFTGHEHVPNPTSEKSVRGGAVYSRAGCLYSSRDYSNGYTLLDVDVRNQLVTMYLRTWYPKRSQFDKAVDRVADGRFEVPLPRCETAGLVNAPAYPTVMAALANMAYNNSLFANYQRDRLPTSVEEVLVEPRFYPAPFQQVAAAVALARSQSRRKAPLKRLNVARLLDNQRVVIVAGEAESGVTFSLYWLLDQRYACDFSRVPVHVNYEVRAGRDPFDGLIRQAAQNIGLSLGPKDERPPLTIAIDDVQVANRQALERLCAHIAGHPNDLYILGCHSDDYHPIREALRSAGVEGTVAHLGPFGRQQARSLISILGPHGVLDHLDGFFDVAFGEGLPRTPFVLAALVAVLITQPEAHPPNVSSLLDALIDLLLGKTDPNYLEAGLDFRRREHLLEFFAAELVQTDNEVLPRADTERLFDDYFQARGFERSISAGNVLNSLIHSRIVVELPHGISFSHGSLQCVLAAKFMLEDANYSKTMLASPMRYSNIIRHAAALRRTDKDLLELVGGATEPVITNMVQTVRSIFDALTSPTHNP